MHLSIKMSMSPANRYFSFLTTSMIALNLSYFMLKTKRRKKKKKLILFPVFFLWNRGQGTNIHFSISNDQVRLLNEFRDKKIRSKSQYFTMFLFSS